MKQRIYIRIGKTKRNYIIRAEKNPNHEPLKFGGFLPTVLIALDLDIPDKEFDSARILLQAKIKETVPAVEIEQVEVEQVETGGSE